MSTLEDDLEVAVSPPAVTSNENVTVDIARKLESKNRSAFRRKQRDKSWISPYIFHSSNSRTNIARKNSSTRSLLAKNLTVQPNKSDIAQVRAPWVPAPAKSTSSYADGGGDLLKPFGGLLSPGKEQGFPIESFSKLQEVNISLKPTHSDSSLKKTNKKFMSSGAKEKLRPTVSANLATSRQYYDRNGKKERRPSYSTLESKDSLVDVTTVLQEKRKEVMKLWQNTLLKDDPSLLTKIEAVNKLAIEAAEEVESLRVIIQDLQKKSSGLTEEDCEKLNGMREKVLQKVKEFEEQDKALQQLIFDAQKKSASKTSLIGGMSNQSKINQTATIEDKERAKLLSMYSLQDVSFLKENSNPDYGLTSEEEKSDEQNEDGEQALLFNMKPPLNPLYSDRSTVASTRHSIENLSKEKATAYDGESLKFPGMQQEGIRLTRSQSYHSGLGDGVDVEHFRHHNHHVRFTEYDIQKTNMRATQQIHHYPGLSSQSESGGESLFAEGALSAGDVYRDKVAHLHRKVMSTEAEVEDLKADIERIESDANFRVRLLQNSVQDKFDSLKEIPDYLQMVDVKLGESIQMKLHFQRELVEKEKFLCEERELTKTLKKEVDELRERLRVSDNLKEFQSFKLTEMERNTAQLRKEVEEALKMKAEMGNQIQMLKDREVLYSTSGSPRVSNMENQRLKLKCSELKEELAQSKRLILGLKKSKSKLAADLNRRIEELLQLLQASQHHKQILGDQIRFLKKSYNELFPCDCESHAVLPHKCNIRAPRAGIPPPSALQTNQIPRSKSKRSKSVSMVRRETKTESVQEPLVKSQVTWKTGREQNATENLLTLPPNLLAKSALTNPLKVKIKDNSILSTDNDSENAQG